MTDDQFAELLALKHEISGVEFKPPGLRTNPYLFHSVARAAMGMANHRDGGNVVIGVRERGGGLDPIGLTAGEIASWRHDLVADAMASLADPPVIFDVQIQSYEARQFKKATRCSMRSQLSHRETVPVCMTVRQVLLNPAAQLASNSDIDHVTSIAQDVDAPLHPVICNPVLVPLQATEHPVG
jgi:hypothetical protein